MNAVCGMRNAEWGVAKLRPEVTYYNNVAEAVRGRAVAWVGDIKVEKDVELLPGSGRISFDPSEFAALKNQELRLWWPNNYGEPYLYDAGFAMLTAAGDTLSVVHFKHGVREVTYSGEDSKLKIYVNGTRIVPLGGNWGFSEQNLRYTAREYDVAVRNHKDMNFNMIRNWVGQVADTEFYDACDKYGILVWQDFWLANPADGPDPADEDMFMSNARDLVAKIRQHPSIAIYCGRNEGYPPATLDKALRELVAKEHGDLTYISSSADDCVSGHGPYWALPAKEYFERQSGMLHTERGMPNIMTIEGQRRTFREEHLWPQNDVWGQHDYTMTGAQKGASFNALIAERFKPDLSLEEFTRYAQLLNYEGYRAMFESGSKERMGLLIWMSHACWPSQTWQCYDYYFEPIGGYYGSRKGCEPLHIQWNASTEEVEVVNIGGEEHEVRAEVEVYDLNAECGMRNAEWTTKIGADSTVALGTVSGEFIRLKLYEGGQLVSENDYISQGNLGAIKPGTLSVELGDGECTVSNVGDTTAYLIRLKLVDGAGEQILPVTYSENYFNLLPGESRRVSISWEQEDQKHEGYDVEATSI